MSDSSNIVHVGQLAWVEQSHLPNYKVFRKPLGTAAGNHKLGCSLYEVPPGCKSWPYHYHYANEEAIYVLEGRGTLRLDGEEIAIASVSLSLYCLVTLLPFPLAPLSSLSSLIFTNYFLGGGGEGRDGDRPVSVSPG
jgi:hypothetical protein